MEDTREVPRPEFKIVAMCFDRSFSFSFAFHALFFNYYSPFQVRRVLSLVTAHYTY
jgi:hypothetical protein